MKPLLHLLSIPQTNVHSLFKILKISAREKFVPIFKAYKTSMPALSRIRQNNAIDCFYCKKTRQSQNGTPLAFQVVKLKMHQTCIKEFQPFFLAA